MTIAARKSTVTVTVAKKTSNKAAIVAAVAKAAPEVKRAPKLDTKVSAVRPDTNRRSNAIVVAHMANEKVKLSWKDGTTSIIKIADLQPAILPPVRKAVEEAAPAKPAPKKRTREEDVKAADKRIQEGPAPKVTTKVAKRTPKQARLAEEAKAALPTVAKGDIVLAPRKSGRKTVMVKASLVGVRGDEAKVSWDDTHEVVKVKLSDLQRVDDGKGVVIKPKLAAMMKVLHDYTSKNAVAARDPADGSSINKVIKANRAEVIAWFKTMGIFDHIDWAI